MLRLRGFALFCIAAVTFSSGAALAQTFLPQGPGPSFGPVNTVQSGDTYPIGGTVSGAVQAVVPDPVDPNTIYLASPVGGIWVTHNGGINWTPLTDSQRSLSISSLSLDPTDPTYKTLIAGTGLTGNGSVCTIGSCFFTGSGGDRAGLLYTKDGGTTWTSLGGSALAGQTVDAVVARGNVILAGTFESSALASQAQQTAGGMYRSTDGGANFTLLGPGSGLPNGPITSIVGDPNSPQHIFAAVTANGTSGAAKASTAVYVSNDYGQTWNQFFNSTNSGGTINTTDQTVIKLAAGPNRSVAIGVIDMTTHQLTGLFWHDATNPVTRSLTVPNINSGAQAPVNFAIAIDPNHSNLVYVSGDRVSFAPYTLAAFRVDATASTPTVTSLTNGGTFDGSTVHSDSRALAFDASGRLIIGTDGGIYVRTSPQNSTGGWQTLNGNLSVFSPYAVAFDAVSRRMVVAGQDNGSTIQASAGNFNGTGTTFSAVGGGDGTNAVINDRTLSRMSAVYTSSQNLGTPSRIILDTAGNQLSPNTAVFGFGAQVNFNIPISNAAGNFAIPFVLNKIDPTKIAIGGDHVYVTQDTLSGANGINALTVNLTLTDLGFTGNVSKLAYGTSDNPSAILAGVTGGLKLSSTPTPGPLATLPAYTTGGGLTPTSVVFDSRSQNRFYAADNSQLFGTTDRGVTFTNLTANLSNYHPTTLEFISNNGVNALLVGGINQIANAKSPITVADSDAAGNLSDWRAFGFGLPNSIISALSYNPVVDVLAVGAFGRGAWALYDVTSYFPQATVLQFGLAGNDSAPDASILTGNRRLIKYGTGTLTIAGDASYTGNTTIGGGTLQIGNGGTTGSILGDVVNLGSLNFNRSNAYFFGGVISGSGVVQQNGTGVTFLIGENTYTGPTFVTSGSLIVGLPGDDGNIHGSIKNSATTVYPFALFGGYGAVGPTTILPFGILSPGNSVGTLTVNGNLLFSPNSLYRVDVVGSTADRTNVTSVATLAGTVVSMFQPGTLARNYTILSAAGGLNGTFDALTTAGLPNFLTAGLNYSSTDVTLNLRSGLAQAAVFNPATGATRLTLNETAVAGALDNTFNQGGGIKGGLNALFNLSAGQLPLALDALTGEVYATEQSVLIDDSRYVRQAVLGRLRQIPYEGSSGATRALGYSGDAVVLRSNADDDGVTDLALSYADKKKKKSFKAPQFPINQQTPGLRDLTFWSQAFGAWGKFNGDGNAADASRSLGGVITGVDATLVNNWQVGLAAGYSQSIAKVDARASSAVADSGHFVAYAGTNAGAWNLRTGAGYSVHEVNTNRSILFPGFADATRAQFAAGTGQVFGEVGYGTAFRNIAVEPFAGLAWVHLNMPGFAETGGAASLVGYSGSADVGYSTIGVRAATSYPMPNGMTVTPRASAAWQHAFGDVTPTSALAFANTTGANFVVAGVPLASDSALIDAGADLRINRQAKVGLSYSSQLSGRTRDNAVKGNFIWKF